MQQDSLSLFLTKKDAELQKLKAELILLTGSQSKATIGQPKLDSFILPLAPSSSKSKAKGKSKASSLNLPSIPAEVGERIKQAFLQYSGPMSFTLTQSNYRKFLNDISAYATVSKTTADLMFFQNNKGKVIDYSQFIRILANLARRFYPSIKPDEAFSRFARQHVIPNLRVSTFGSELDSMKALTLGSEAREAIAYFSSLTSQVFKAYKRSSPETQDSLHLNDFLLFLNQFYYIPDILSQSQAAEIFRTAQHHLSFDDFIRKQQFEYCILFMALWSYRDGPVFERVSRWFKYLEVNPELLRNVGLLGAHTTFIGFSQEME